MPTETPTQPLRHAWAVVKYNAQSGDTENPGDAALALIEPGIRLLELSARYREARALHVEAVAACEASPGPRAVWQVLHAKIIAAESDMEAAKHALLSAALAIT